MDIVGLSESGMANLGAPRMFSMEPISPMLGILRYKGFKVPQNVAV